MPKRSPKLLFTDEERATPGLKQAIRRADKQIAGLEKAESKLPKSNIRGFIDKDHPAKSLHSLRGLPTELIRANIHHGPQSEGGDVSADTVEAALQTGKTVYHAGCSAYRAHKLRPYRNVQHAEKLADRANLNALYKESEQQSPQTYSNAYSRWRQKRAIKKEYVSVKMQKESKNSVRASETVARAARRTTDESRKIAGFFVRHRKGLIVIAIFASLTLFLVSAISSCTILFQGPISGIAASTYPSADQDMLAAETRYCAMEQELQERLDDYEAEHHYDEYHFELDRIGHDPYVLISLLTALHGGEWIIQDVQDTLEMLFGRQYIVTETLRTETRYRQETRTEYVPVPNTSGGSTLVPHTYTVQVPYTYFICTVTLKNFDLSHLPVYLLSEDKLSVYAMYMASLGNRPDLFPDSSYIGQYITGEYEDYEIPPEVLEDDIFASMITEAEKYLGYPYVWGGSSPSTSFDCSGFVSWVLNHSGWELGRLGAQGLLNQCTRVGSAEVQPGDLIFFQGTYDTTGASHVGIYVGNGMMIHCGDPIQYESIETNYWQSHFLAFGRLPNP